VAGGAAVLRAVRQALQGRPGTTVLDGIVDNWLDPLTSSVIRYRHPADQARTHPASAWP